MSNTIAVSIIICTYNREDYILDALYSVKDQTVDPSAYELIVIDNNSTDKTPLLCMQFAQSKGNVQFEYFKESKQGLSHARNRGIAEAKGNIIVFLDDDAVACKEYVHEVQSFFSHSEYMAMGGRILPKYESNKPKWMPDELTPLYSILEKGKGIKPFKNNAYPVGANMAFRKEVFALCGEFNTALGRTGKNLMGGEEKDIFARIKNHGLQSMYYSDAWVYHIIPNNRTSIEFIKKQAIGVGLSEYYRTHSNTTQYIVSLCKEFLKWIATAILSVKYLILAEPSKIKTLFLFRAWVASGLLHRTNITK